MRGLAIGTAFCLGLAVATGAWAGNQGKGKVQGFGYAEILDNNGVPFSTEFSVHVAEKHLDKSRVEYWFESHNGQAVGYRRGEVDCYSELADGTVWISGPLVENENGPWSGFTYLLALHDGGGGGGDWLRMSLGNHIPCDDDNQPWKLAGEVPEHERDYLIEGNIRVRPSER